MNKQRSLIKSFGYALSGLRFAWKEDRNIRIHLIAMILVIILSIYFQVNAFEMGILAVMIILVLTTEMVNTAIEKTVDLITKEYREEAKIAKDIGAGMVLISAVGAFIVGILIFAPYILKFVEINF